MLVSNRFLTTALCAAFVRSIAAEDVAGEDVAPLNSTDCGGITVEGDVDCSASAVELGTGPMTNGTECNGTSFEAPVDCTMIGSVEDADDEKASSEMGLEGLDSTSDDNDLLADVTAFELFFRPAWAGALSRTLMGWNPGTPSQLTWNIPGDGSSSNLGTSQFCDEVGGSFLSSGE